MVAPSHNTAPPLTVKAIEAAKPREKEYELRDGGAPGLRLRISPKGARVFRWYVTSARRVITIGHWTKIPTPHHVTLQEARGWLEKLKQAYTEGRLDEVEGELRALRPGPRREAAQQEAGAPTVHDVAEAFMRYMKRERKRPEQAQRPLDYDILPAIGDRPIDSITSQDCRGIVEAVVDRGSPRQAGVVLAILKQFFSFAMDRGDVDVNPADRFRNPRVLGIEENISQRFLSPEEIAAFWHALDAYRRLTPTVRNGLRLLLLTGVRSGELLKARIDAVDLEARTWTIPVEDQKLTRARERTARPFVVPLAPMALELFEDLHALSRSLKSQFVMASLHAKGGDAPLTEKSLAHAMRRLFEGDDPFLSFEGERPTPHDLRRTLRTHVETLGVSYTTAERLLNHSLGRIATTYDVGDHLEERREALERWEGFLRRLIDPTSNVVELPNRRRGLSS